MDKVSVIIIIDIFILFTMGMCPIIFGVIYTQ